MLAELDTYDWGEAFKYARSNVESVIGDEVSEDGFDREDVAQILALIEGENDGPEWVGIFRLADRRFAMLAASCDYTGWG
jgi:hypothetical protein